MTLTGWTRAASSMFVALSKVATDKTLLDDMAKPTQFRYTGDNEVFHSTLLRWVPKRIHFSYEGMRARTQLACLDYNNNCACQQSTTKDGERRWKIVFPKSKWIAKPIYRNKTHNYIHELMETVYETKEQLSSSSLPECMALYSGQPLGLPVNIATEEQPCRDDVIVTHCSQMQFTSAA